MCWCHNTLPRRNRNTGPTRWLGGSLWLTLALAKADLVEIIVNGEKSVDAADCQESNIAGFCPPPPPGVIWDATRMDQIQIPLCSWGTGGGGGCTVYLYPYPCHGGPDCIIRPCLVQDQKHTNQIDFVYPTLLWRFSALHRKARYIQSTEWHCSRTQVFSISAQCHMLLSWSI